MSRQCPKPVLFFISAYFLGGQWNAGYARPDGEKRAYTADGRISIAIPEGWIQEPPRPGYTLLLMVDAPAGRFSANLSLRLDPSPWAGKNAPGHDLVFKALKDDVDAYFKDSYRNLAQKSLEVRRQKIVAATYEFPSRSVFLSCKQYVILRGSLRCLFTAVALAADMPKLEMQFDRIVQSVVFK